MAPTRLCAVLGVILCATTACAKSGQGGAPPDQSGITATTLPLPSGPPPTGPIQVIPDPRAIDLKPHAWISTKALAGNSLRIDYLITGQAACNVLGKVEVAETATAVTLTLHVGRFPEASCGAKILKAANVFTEVELDTPLGTRTTADGSK